jgi:hypothetical protein
VGWAVVGGTAAVSGMAKRLGWLRVPESTMTHSSVAHVSERCRKPLNKPAKLQFTIRDLIILTAIAAIVAASFAYYYRPRPSLAEKNRDAALKQAKKEDKLVLLVFAVHSEGWSDRLDAFHADAAVRGVLEKYFVLKRIDVEEPGGMEMYMERGPRGVPAFSILDTKGSVISDSGQGNENFGFPNSDNQVDRYIDALTAASPNLKEYETTLLRMKLEGMRVRPKKQ